MKKLFYKAFHVFSDNNGEHMWTEEDCHVRFAGENIPEYKIVPGPEGWDMDLDLLEVGVTYSAETEGFAAYAKPEDCILNSDPESDKYYEVDLEGLIKKRKDGKYLFESRRLGKRLTILKEVPLEEMIGFAEEAVAVDDITAKQLVSRQVLINALAALKRRLNEK